MLSVAEVFRPFEPVDVDANEIPETELVSVQVALDRLPDRSWCHLFAQALSSGRPAGRSTATFLGRFIYLQPQRSDLDLDVAAVRRAIAEANARYAEDVPVVRHQGRAVAVA